MSPNQSYIYLHKVEGTDGKNHNKFYEMKADTGGGTFTATYGREGAEKPQKKVYPMSDWESVYREKTGSKKGYTDVTAFKSVATPTTPASVKNSKGQIISTDAEIVFLITKLQEYANVATKASYKVEAKSVTQAQVDAAQLQINNLAASIKHFGKSDWDINAFNKALTHLMIIIPRKMKNVADHLMAPTDKRDAYEKLIADEQSLLDSMASQVTTNTAATGDTSKDSNNDGQTTLLEALGLKMRVATPAEFKEAVSYAKDHGHKVKKVFVVVNEASQKLFDANMKASANKQTKLLWHGSRRANWWFILQQSLKIRPSNAASFAGSAFGDGIYFASEDDKSMGYTDGGRWNSGSGGGKAMTYMALYEVRVGKQYVIYDNSTLSSVSTSKAKQVLASHGNCDSTWARKKSDRPSSGSWGYGLMRDEYIIYNSDQCTIKYLLEFDN